MLQTGLCRALVSKLLNKYLEKKLGFKTDLVIKELNIVNDPDSDVVNIALDCVCHLDRETLVMKIKEVV